MSTIKVDTIATRTGSGSITVSNDASLSGTLGVTGTSTLSGTLNMSSSHIQFSGNVSLPNVGAALFRPAADTIAFGINNGQRVSVNEHGLLFGTDTAAANALDDYEEGTWTPSWALGSGQSYGSQIGTYVKIGRQVMVTCFIQTSDMNGQTGDATVAGLPFTASQGAFGTFPRAWGVVNGDNNWDTNLSTQNLVAQISGGANSIRPRYNSGLNTVDVQLQNIGGGNSYFGATVVYETDS